MKGSRQNKNKLRTSLLIKKETVTNLKQDGQTLKSACPKQLLLLSKHICQLIGTELPSGLLKAVHRVYIHVIP